MRKTPTIHKLREIRASLLTAVFLPLAIGGLAARFAGADEVFVAMRDGVELATDVLRPDGAGPWPCVLSRTPYDKKGLAGQAKSFVAAGYVFVGQDCRGKFRSKGDYDGYDTVEWVAAQPWSNGRVGMTGGSALGITSNLAATQAPPHLRCAYVVVAPASARRNTVYIGGVYRKEMNDGWLTMQGAKFAIDVTMQHPPGDRFWDWREIGDFWNRIDIPVYNVGGWYDIFSQGTLDNFVGLQTRGRGLAAGNQKLVIGPFAHGPMGGRSKYPEARPDEWLGTRRQILWFDRWLKGDRNAIDDEPPVRYYVLGDTEDPDAPGNEWRSASSWPPPSRPASFFLAPGGDLRRGELATAPADGESSRSYDYDPTKPVPTVGGNNLIRGGRGPLDQRQIGERDDYLRFQTAPLVAPLEIAGRVSCELFVASDAPDTDFVAKLVDVYPDGYEALVVDGIVRARYREGLEREVFLTPGEVVSARIDLWSTAYAFHRGHRLAVHVSSSNDPRFDPNPNTGRRQRADDETRVARNTVHFSERYPSRLLLPVTDSPAAALPAAEPSVTAPPAADSK